MVAARMLHPQDLATESLSVFALYKSTLASNRKSEKEVLLGPTGGCALLSRRLLEDLLLKTHGEWFDGNFFLLCRKIPTSSLRARWLNYKPAFAAEAVVYHSVGSLSSGGAGKRIRSLSRYSQFALVAGQGCSHGLVAAFDALVPGPARRHHLAPPAPWGRARALAAVSRCGPRYAGNVQKATDHCRDPAGSRAGILSVG